MSRRCILWGGYAHGNVGDELTLAVAIHDARRDFGDSVAVLTPNRAYTARQFPDVDLIPYRLRKPPRPVRWWMRVRKWAQRLPGRETGREPKYRWKDQESARSDGAAPWIEAIQEAGHLVLVGGGYLADLFPLEVYLFPLEVAHAAGVSVRTDPVGIGPITSSRSAARLAEALRSAEVVVRDTASLELCREQGIPASFFPDAGFRVREVVAGLDRLDRAEAANRRLRVAICATRQEGSGSPAVARNLALWWVRFVRAVSHLEGVTLTGLCFHADPSKDLAFTREAFRGAGLDPDLVAPPGEDFRDAIRDLAAKDAIVTARFHAAVVAGALSLPCVAIASGDYSTAKMRSVEEYARATTRLIDPATVEPEAAAQLVETLCSVPPPRPRPS